MEIFTALQGEGPWVGIRQIFFRLFRCNLRCAWCDTTESFEQTGKGFIEVPPGSRNFREFENPVSPETAMEFLSPFLRETHHSISLTGGEPLVQHHFLKAILPLLKEKKEKIFLETGGTLPEFLSDLIGFIDFVSMDLKLPSSTEERPFWEKHEKFLKLSAQKEVYVKIVLTKDTLDEEIERAAALVNRIAPTIPVILQPVTSMNGTLPPTEKQLLRWHARVLRILPGARVIPQVHKLIGVK